MKGSQTSSQVRRQRLALLLLVFLSISGSVRMQTPEPSSQSQKEQIAKLLSDPVLWRKDFPSLLATLKSWNESGENRVVVFDREVFGLRKFSLETREALGEAGELHLLMKRKPDLKPEFEAQLKDNLNTSLTTLTPVSQPAGDESVARVSLTTKSIMAAELLAPGLTIATVKQQSGEPEFVTSELIDSGDERRPTILTLYHYAGDSIAFAVSDLSPGPDLVQRAFLNTAKISEALFSTPPQKK